MSEVTNLDRRRFKNWFPVIAWAAVIFLFSTETFSSDNTASWFAPWLHWTFPTWSNDSIELAHTVIRKLGHVSEYFIFALLLLRALHAEMNVIPGARRIFVGIGLLTFYAMSDESHQVFVPGRTPTPTDVLIDICGGLAGILCFLFWTSRKAAKTKNS
jgi:VanZ family protein